MPKRFDVVTVGSAVRDVMFRTPAALVTKHPRLIGFTYGTKIQSDDVHRFYGGGAMNTAVCFARLGLHTGIVIRVGDDADGQAMINHLQSEHVDTKYVQHDRHVPTGVSFLIVEPKTNEHVALVDYGANTQLIFPALTRQPVPKWFYVSSLNTPRWPVIMKQLIRTKAHIAWNPGATQLADAKKMLPFLTNVDVLIVNKAEAAKVILRTKPTIFIITNGQAGATAYTKGQRYSVKPKNKRAKDTTGAGDAFGASFVAGLIKTQGNISTALQIATINATAEVSQIGVQNGLLRWTALQRKLKRT